MVSQCETSVNLLDVGFPCVFFDSEEAVIVLLWFLHPGLE